MERDPILRLLLISDIHLCQPLDTLLKGFFMKINFFLILFIFASFSSLAIVFLSQESFASGGPAGISRKTGYKLPLNEKLVFKVKAMGLALATQTNTTRGIVKKDGRNAINIFSNVKTHKWILMYGIDNTMETFIDAETLNPLFYEERANEKDWKAVETVTFFKDRMKYSAKKGLKLDRKEDVENQYQSGQWPQDELSMTYYVRQLPLEAGKTFTMYACVDSGLVKGTVKVLEKTTIKTIHGKKEVFYVTSSIGDSKFHISADEKRIPYRFEVKLNFGVAQGTLDEYSAE